MRRPLAVTALTLGLAAVCGLAAVTALRPPTAPPAAPPVGAPAGAPAGRGDPPADGSGAPASTSAMAATQPERAAPSTARSLSVYGSCVEWDSDAPVDGCEVRVRGDDLGPVATSTDGQGRFALALTLPIDAGEVEVRISCPQHLTVVRRLSQPLAGDLVLGAVRLRRGADVEGTLHDEHGHPQVGATIELRYGQTPARGDGFDETYATRARTLADGSFTCADPVPAGIVDVTVLAAPPLLDANGLLLAAGSSTRLELVCRAVAAGDRIRGIARDRGGRPVAQALVQAFATAAGEGPPAAWSHTDGDGRFVLYRLGGGDASVRLTALDLRSGERAAGGAWCHWGSDEVELRLGGDDGIRLQVVDATSGTPVEAYAVQCVPTAGVRSPAAGAMRNDGRHDGGWTWLDGLVPGPHAVIVWPHDPRWLPSLPRSFAVDERGGSVQVALARAEPCRVRVVDEAGQPVPGARLELLRPAGGSVTRDLHDLFRHGGVRGPVHIRLATATTDAEGRADLRWFADPEPLQLRVHGPTTAAHVEDGVRLGGGERLVRVPAVGQLRLALHGAGGSRLLLREVAGARELPPAWQQPFAVDDDGRLQLAVPTGQWQLRLALQPEHDDRTATCWLPSPSPFATVAIAAGATTELELDLRPTLATGALTGTAFVDGQPARRVVLQFGAVGDDGSRHCVHQVDGAPDARGRFRYDGLRAGDYSLQLRTTCAGRPLSVPVAGWQQLAPGQRLELPPIALTTATATIELRDRDGRAVRDAHLILNAAAGFVLLGVPDDDGRVQFDDLPTGSYALHLQRGGERVDVGAFEVAAGGANRRVVEFAR